MIYVGEFANIIQYQSFRFFEFYAKYVELMVSYDEKRTWLKEQARQDSQYLELFCSFSRKSGTTGSALTGYPR